LWRHAPLIPATSEKINRRLQSRLAQGKKWKLISKITGVSGLCKQRDQITPTSHLQPSRIWDWASQKNQGTITAQGVLGSLSLCWDRDKKVVIEKERLDKFDKWKQHQEVRQLRALWFVAPPSMVRKCPSAWGLLQKQHQTHGCHRVQHPGTIWWLWGLLPNGAEGSEHSTQSSHDSHEPIPMEGMRTPQPHPFYRVMSCSVVWKNWDLKAESLKSPPLGQRSVCHLLLPPSDTFGECVSAGW
jgi:hypothetical protein